MVYGKKEIVDLMAKKGYTKKDAGIALKDLLDTITEIVAAGHDLNLYMFGNFIVRDMPEKYGNNVRTHERFIIPSHKVVRFVPSQCLRKYVKEGFVE